MNGYFQLINGEGQTGVCLYPPIGDGIPLDMNEVVDYLNFNEISFSIPPLYSAAKKLKKTPVEIIISKTEYPPIREVCRVRISRDSMTATIRFYPPSTNGHVLKRKDILSEIEKRGVRKGIIEDTLEALFEAREYCRDYTIATGLDTVHGMDGKAEFYFEPQATLEPDLLSDGSVDFKHLLKANNCLEGDTIARLIPPTNAVNGYTVKGDEFAGEPGTEAKLKSGRNVEIDAADGGFRALVEGRVRLERDRVIVSPLIRITGSAFTDNRFEYEGSIIIEGDVRGGIAIKAKGDVIISGKMQDSFIDAGGDIIICQGMDGRNKGSLRAKGNILGASFVNSKLKAGKRIFSDILLHSTVMAGDIIKISGPRGIIAGGIVSARNGISTKVLGSDDGKLTICEVGSDPALKEEIDILEAGITDRDKMMKEAYPILSDATGKISRGEALSAQQLKSIKELHTLYNEKKKGQKRDKARLTELKDKLSLSRNAKITVGLLTHPGTHISIGESSVDIENRTDGGVFYKERDIISFDAAAKL